MSNVGAGLTRLNEQVTLKSDLRGAPAPGVQLDGGPLARIFGVSGFEWSERGTEIPKRTEVIRGEEKAVELSNHRA